MGAIARELGRKEDHGAGRESHFSLGSWGGGAGRALSLHGGRQKVLKSTGKQKRRAGLSSQEMRQTGSEQSTRE